MINCGRCFAALDTDNFFLVVVSDPALNSVFHVEYTTGNATQLIPHDDLAYPFAVAYDPTTKFVYWSDVVHTSISRYSLLWRNMSTVYYDS